MKIVRKTAFILSAIFLATAIVLTVFASFFNFHILIGSFTTNHIISVLSGFLVILVSFLFLTNPNVKTVIAVCSVVLLVLAQVIMLVVTFYPKYQYTEYRSEEYGYTIVVGEKESLKQTSVTFFEKSWGIFYESVHGVTFDGDAQANYKFGDYIILLDEDYTRVNIPSSNETQSLSPH